MIIGQLAVGGTIFTTYLGAFSRLTHGRYTPSFYTYQLDRAPDDPSTRVIPYVDAALGTLLLFSKTRALAAGVCVLFQGIGVVMRVQSGKSPVKDVGLCLVATGALLGSLGMI